MPTNTRQSSLLVAEDWKKIYQTFQEADFTSYDFETLRKSMLDYIKLYYPEDFNDFTESSEFVALIDLIAFMGQSLAFRADLNARENFIDTAERRDSILKLAKLISYNPKRNISASGLLKIDNVSTTETLYDSNGLNLSNLLVNWNDSSNDNWLEQFTTVINAALINVQVVGKPGNSQKINGVTTDEYSLNTIQNVLSLYKFTSSIEGNNFDFEAVSATTIGKDYVYEAAPNTNAPFNILYRNDNFGNESNNTGFFVYFKQGSLLSKDFSVNNPVPNRIVAVEYTNINNTDVWLYQVNSNNTLGEQWTSVPAVAGINVIYNQNTARNLYQINTRAGDQIDLVFGDGSFANMPKGNYRVYFRVGNGLTYKITPDEMQGVTLNFRYVSRTGRVETLTIRASLHYTVTNAIARESIDEIKQRAPQQYYTQNRMITGEDYNIVPYTSFGKVLKAKSINRTSSGISRFLDVIDTTGKYSSTNIFCQDGSLYRNIFVRNFNFKPNTKADVLKIINNQISKTLASKEMLHFYYAHYPVYTVSGVTWKLSSTGSNSSTGYFVLNGLATPVGGTVRTNARYIRKGAIVKFRAPVGYYFDANANLIAGTSTALTDNEFLFACVMEVFGNGTVNGAGTFSNGTGAITLNIKVPSLAEIDTVYPVFKNNFAGYQSDEIASLVSQIKTFGLTYNNNRQGWEIIYPENLSTGNDFSLTNQGDTTGTGADASWIIKFQHINGIYTVYYRGLEYIFHSPEETTFFFDQTVKVFDTKTGTVINDQIKILKTNSSPDSAAPLGRDQVFYVYDNFVDVDGYVSKDRILITYADTNNDGIPDNPELFNLTVAPNTNPQNKYVYFQQITNSDNFSEYMLLNSGLIVSQYATYLDLLGDLGLFLTGQKFYTTEEKKFYQLSATRTLIELTDHVAFVGRQNLAFQYRHNSPSDRRIDPSSTNVNDIYILTSEYESSYREWLRDTSGTVKEPKEPTNYELNIEFGSLNDVRSISDTIVFNSARFKPLFGSKATSKLQATFKVVKNSSLNISDNDIKTSVINAINTYFDIANWDFGETFYFSELSAYLHRVLSPNISSIIIVPSDPASNFGNLYQINAEPYEIIVSAATVENVEIISAVTASQLNLTFSV